MSDYATEIVRLVTEESAAGTSHRKVLEPLLNMVASVVSGIKQEHGVDDMPLVKAQLDKFADKYTAAYEAQGSTH